MTIQQLETALEYKTQLIKELAKRPRTARNLQAIERHENDLIEIGARLELA